jgi:hypothetical protein
MVTITPAHYAALLIFAAIGASTIFMWVIILIEWIRHK